MTRRGNFWAARIINNRENIARMLAAVNSLQRYNFLHRLLRNLA